MEEDPVSDDGLPENPEGECEYEQESHKEQPDDYFGLGVICGIGPYTDSQYKQKHSTHINNVLIDKFGQELDKKQEPQSQSYRNYAGGDVRVFGVEK